MTDRERPAEQEAITTTIVGGRPPGCGQPVGAIPRGVEVLIKKAAVDPEFRARLLEHRAQAADEIGLTLQPPEALMLQAVPRAQLEQIIDHTRIRPEHKPVFLGKVAALMLLAIGAQTLNCECPLLQSRGNQPDRPQHEPAMEGIRPDHPYEQVEPADPLTRGVRPDRPEQTVPQVVPAEPAPSEAVSRGVRPDRVTPPEVPEELDEETPWPSRAAGHSARAVPKPDSGPQSPNEDAAPAAGTGLDAVDDDGAPTSEPAGDEPPKTEPGLSWGLRPDRP